MLPSKAVRPEVLKRVHPSCQALPASITPQDTIACVAAASAAAYCPALQLSNTGGGFVYTSGTPATPVTDKFTYKVGTAGLQTHVASNRTTPSRVLPCNQCRCCGQMSNILCAQLQRLPTCIAAAVAQHLLRAPARAAALLHTELSMMGGTVSTCCQ